MRQHFGRRRRPKAEDLPKAIRTESSRPDQYFLTQIKILARFLLEHCLVREFHCGSFAEVRALSEYARCPAILMSQRYHDDSVQPARFAGQVTNMTEISEILVQLSRGTNEFLLES